MRYELKNVQITSYSMNGSSEGADNFEFAAMPDEGRAPAHSSEWTDFNDNDPGAAAGSPKIAESLEIGHVIGKFELAAVELEDLGLTSQDGAPEANADVHPTEEVAFYYNRIEFSDGQPEADAFAF